MVIETGSSSHIKKRSSSKDLLKMEVIIETDPSLLLPPECPFCDAIMVKGVEVFKQYGRLINVVANNFPEYECLECGIKVYDSRALLEFKKKELAIRRQYEERGSIRIIQGEIRNILGHIH
ncbi:MAG: hypothetical protein Q7R97_04545 [Candidatus Daviesbacteria bacterium]|nr:hypothetical protein [Candidatus Daviesbacteria bacterium]